MIKILGIILFTIIGVIFLVVPYFNGVNNLDVYQTISLIGSTLYGLMILSSVFKLI